MKSVLGGIGAAAMCVLAACSSGAPPPPVTITVTASPLETSSVAPTSTSAKPSTTSRQVRTSAAPSTTERPSRSVQEPLQKRLGQIAGLGPDACTSTTSSACWFTFTVTKVTGCTGTGYWGDPPPKGTHRKLIWLSVTTTRAYDPDMNTPHDVTDFVAISKNGVTGGPINVNASWYCVDARDEMGFHDHWQPGQKYVGAVEVYLPDGTAKVSNGDGMWQWRLA